MDRRELLKSIAILTGSVVIGADVFLSGCTAPANRAADPLSEKDIALLDEIGETILPATAASPGAKAAKIGAFMKIIVADCYDEKDQKAFYAGLKKIDADCQKKTGKVFMDCNEKERQEFLVSLEKDIADYQKQKDQLEAAERAKDKDFKGLGNHYYTYMKQLTLWGYFSSEIGSTKALRYERVPGRFEGCVPYHKGDRSWA